MRFLRLIAGVVLLAALATACTSEGEPQSRTAAKQERRPNVLLIVTDDQREGLEVMPKTRRWFGEGGREFTNAYTTVPVCCPSRAGLFTGQYFHNHGVTTNSGVDNLDPQTTLQSHLQDAGYRTAMFGKYMNGWEEPPPNFDYWATRTGRDRYSGANWNVQGETKFIDQYSTDFVADSTVDFLAQAEEEDDSNPCFVYVATDAPHAPSEAAPKYADARVPEWQVDRAVLEPDPKGHYTTQFARTLMGFEEGEATREKMYRALMSVDDLVGDVATTLDELDEENTIALYTSDNGYMWGEHGLSEKTQPYTESIAVPFLVRWPGEVEAGATDDRLVGNIDVAPTALDAAGLSAEYAASMDGHSVLDETWSRDRLLAEHQDDPKSATTPTWASLRTNEYQYIEYYESNGKTIAFREYYDLTSDPEQMDNLLADGIAGNDPDVKALSRQLAADRACSGSECP